MEPMTNPQLILDRLTAWVEKQSSVGPASFRQALAEIRKDVAREERGRLDSGIAIQHEAFETAKAMLTANPVLKRRLQLWLADEPVEPLVQELGTALGEFARDELGTTLADVDAAIAADKEQERAAKPKKRAAKPKARKK